MRIVFLHIPKTAGQSVHTALVSAFGEEMVCPARVNEQLKTYTIRELNQYQVFSGHLDWAMLDCLKGPSYQFTVLRKPIDRILSFYFYLKQKSEGMSQEQLLLPHNQGMRAAKELSPNDYFGGGEKHLRSFLDDHYDNFYTYFFAGRRFNARNEFQGVIRRGEMSEDRLTKMAKDNLTCLDMVFSQDDLGKVLSAISDISGKSNIRNEDYKINVNSQLPADDRVAQLERLGANDQTFRRLEHFCRLDDKLWDVYR
jgi:hypothetical protein